jgi:imidazolonepropionase-like amidohydrolase
VAEKEPASEKDMKTIDLEGCTLLPGMIDCHVHLCLDGSQDPIVTSGAEPVATNVLKAAKFALQTLMAGVTTIRDLGGRDGVDLGLRDAIRSGLIPGPRMLVSGSLICMTGGHGWQIGREANGPEEVRKAAREQIKKGADIVKLMATGGVMTPGVEPGSAQLTEAELRAGIEEAHKAGRKTATHAMGTNGVLNALRAGIDSIEHGVFLNDEAVSLMAEKQVPFIPTLAALINIEVNGIEAGIPAFAVEKTLRVKPHHRASIQLAKEAGVHIAMGTDAGTPFNYHGQNLRELKYLVEQGFTPGEAIESGTGIASKALGLDDQLGSIEEGKLADLIVVEGNPLEEIELLLQADRLRLIMQGGRIVKEEM